MEALEDKDLKKVGLELMFLTPEKCSREEGITAVELAKCLDMPLDTVKKITGYNDKRKEITIDGIIATVAEFYNVSVDDIKGDCRTARYANPRQVAIYLAKELTSESFPSIGAAFNRKHTTIMYAHKTVKSDIAIDRHLAQDITELTTTLNE